MMLWRQPIKKQIWTKRPSFSELHASQIVYIKCCLIYYEVGNVDTSTNGQSNWDGHFLFNEYLGNLTE